jgi:plastocyanin
MASVASDLTVAIENFGFGTATVKVGDTLTWTNVDGVAHTVTAGSGGRSNGGFDSGFVDPGGSFQVKFDQPGRFSYTCTLHPFMSDTVMVTP